MQLIFVQQILPVPILFPFIFHACFSLLGSCVTIEIGLVNKLEKILIFIW